MLEDLRVLGGIVVVVLATVLLLQWRRKRSYTFPEAYPFANTVGMATNDARLLDYIMDVCINAFFHVEVDILPCYLLLYSALRLCQKEPSLVPFISTSSGFLI